MTENKKKKAEENKEQHHVADLYPCPEGSGLHTIGRLVTIVCAINETCRFKS
jgi:hypothetical protein